MATFGEIKIGRLTLREDSLVGISPDEFGSTRLRVVGQESMPRLNLDQIRQRVDDITSLHMRMVPIQFSHKPELNGYYFVETVTATYDFWHGHDLAVIPWDMSIARIGYDNEIDIESRLSGPITRINDFAATGERWNSPPIGHYAYYVAGALPTITIRDTEEGQIRVYRGILQTSNPRYGCNVADYDKGRVRLIDSNELERVGVANKIDPNSWKMHNGLIMIEPDLTSTIRFSYWIDGDWQNRSWIVSDSEGYLQDFDSLTVLQNDLESCTIRLMKSRSTGRRSLDLTIRRGSQIVEGYFQRSDSGSMSVGLETPEVGTQTQGFLNTSESDANGVKYVVGSLKAFTPDLNMSISKVASVSMDFFLSAYAGYEEIAPNSEFDTDSSGWEGVAGTNLSWVGGSAIATSTGLAQSTGIQTTGNGFDSGSAGGISGYHQFQMFFNGSVNLPDVDMHIDWKDDAGALISTTSADFGAINSGPRSASANHLAPAGARYADLRITVGQIITDSTVAFDRISLNKYNPGDQPLDLYKQYLGVPAEFVQGVRR